LLLMMAVVMVLSPLVSPLGFGSELSDKKDEYDNTVKNIKDTEQKISEGEKKANELMAEISVIERDIYAAQVEINILTVDLNATKEKIKTALDELAELQGKMDKQNAALMGRLRAMYKQGDIGLISVLLGSSNMTELITNVEMMKMIYEADALKSEILRLQSSGSYVGGVMGWPSRASTRITDPFGMRLHPFYGYYKLHTGIDIGAGKRTDILAAADGTVIKTVISDHGYGNYVMIDHGGGIVTLYAHSSKLIAKKGDKVKRGETIALVGSSGMSTGPHIHFEVRVNGVYKDPLDYVTPGRY
ncbi:MAG: peptidoglycan DD-metalloendopeptidase family protein, partial [Firmicutes bacterium]|nr:peptidoglycan DD-metalloendopeptidase family protein [Bacillota bacterium]